MATNHFLVRAIASIAENTIGIVARNFGLG